jgi:rSAM/selenodomain-associated transferase 1
MQLCVIAKEPRPGFAKTRLTPPCSPHQAAAIAAAALADTLDTAATTSATRHVIALDGVPGAWLPAGFDIIAQPPGGLGDRLDAAFADMFRADPHEPALLIGMDTPQVTRELLERAALALERGADAVLGEASDGGYWMIGMRRFVPGAFDGVPMSTTSTARAQRHRLEQLGCRIADAERLDDVDSFDDAVRVATGHPGGRFGVVVGRTIDAISAMVG